LFWTVGDAGPYCCGLSGLAITGAHRKTSSSFYGSNAVAFAVSFASFLVGTRKEERPPHDGSNAGRSPFLLLLFLRGQEKKASSPTTNLAVLPRFGE
ncbi:MAG: hypothetical protein IJV98_05685, partial [Clostridia bacterium]|nr:hypothetical protein [Clostridia bacterium]